MSQQPNILFIFSDQQHWEAMGFEDSSFTTPHLDRLAAEGTVFSQAFCTTPQCSPSRASMLTGLYPSRNGVLGNVGAAGGEPLRMPTVGAVLQGAGYRTAYFGKWHLGQEEAGIAGWDEELGITEPRPADGEVTRRALDFLSRQGESDQPFALFLSYNNPHDIYEFSSERDPEPAREHILPETWHAKDFAAVPRVHAQFMEEDQGRVIVDAETRAWERYREIYREKTRLYDEEVGTVLAALAETGEADETLVLATSDHGDMDTQHRLIYKGPFMYEHMMRVPLIIRLPAGQRGRAVARVDASTVNVDLLPTLCAYAGVEVPSTDGSSLLPLLFGEASPVDRSAVIGQYYSKQRWVNPIRMLRTDEWKYIRYQTHGEELYNLKEDPQELKNCAGDDQAAGAKAELSARLDRWLQDHDDPFDTQAPTTRSGEPLSAEEEAARRG
ncbi:MAG: sulfatase family protein [Planctomycetota bacterium]